MRRYLSVSDSSKVLCWALFLSVTFCGSGALNAPAACRLKTIPCYEDYEYFQDGDVVLGGVFTVNCFMKYFVKDGIIRYVQCMLPQSLHYKNILTFMNTIQDLNEMGFLPNITLGYHLYDSCSDGIKAVKSILQILSGPGPIVPNYCCGKKANVAGIIGDHYSITTIPMAQILGMYRYTQISYGTTSFRLSDKNDYPTIFRALQNDHINYSTLSKLLSYFGWTWVGIIASNDDSGDEETQALTEYMAINGICPAYLIKTSRIVTATDHIIGKRNQNIIRKSRAKVIVLCGSYSIHVVNALVRLQEVLKDKTIIIGPTWALNTFFLNKMPVIFNGSLALDIYAKFVTWYRIMNWKAFRNYTWMLDEIGYFDPSDQKLFLDKKIIHWKNPNNQMPESQCSDNCLPGNRKLHNSSIYTCCYGCVPCSEGEISNITGSEKCLRCPDNEWPAQWKNQCIPKLHDFLSYSSDGISMTLISLSILFSLITALILGIYVSYRATAIVKANNRNLSFLLLVSIILSFLCVFLFLGRPEDVTCMLRQTAFGVIFSVAVSSLLAKTIMVCIAFKATKPGSYWRKWIGVKVSNSIVLFCSSIQIIISIGWLALAPPFQELDMRSYQGKIIIQCNEGSVIAFYCVLGYLGLLAAVSFIIAFLARTLPDSFNEAKYITFSMLVFCSVWIAMIPAYLSTKGKYMVAVEIFAILASSAGLLGCIFFPKCYIILCRPELNTKTHLFQNR
ncbi:vomeronasal type-2 receptor 26-like [Spea bombifrons]|uniref:vomeronasal type-2 receptor 26-like n=1 Tax=Spea bombifrons TaxID=233779 RepID=UPI00234AD900|nr:vomeronasal type-2 receptor 26-like [Spea bombifrons]